ncbi:MAG: polysaccharide biosynthesis/export family protein [Chthoniobacterales bacterium]|nr:polysaccharide biosynthesis/export family protein [Chthoniobacterales bacterium]
MRPFLAVLFAVSALVIAADPAGASDAVFRNGDTIELRIGGVPAEETQLVTGAYTVDGEGFVNLPHIGKVRATGLNQAALQRAIESAYRSGEIYTNPTITITVPTTLRFVNVSGDVRQPRRVEYTSDLTVLGAISAAGGFTEYADQRKVRLLRAGQVRVIDIKAVRSNPSLDVQLLPGDQIEVPQSFW